MLTVGLQAGEASVQGVALCRQESASGLPAVPRSRLVIRTLNGI
jgi:hypothetical protein